VKVLPPSCRQGAQVRLAHVAGLADSRQIMKVLPTSRRQTFAGSTLLDERRSIVK